MVETSQVLVRMRSRKISRSQIAAVLLLPLVLPVLGVLMLLVLVVQGRPFLFKSERMKDADNAFNLYKIRTMVPAPGVPEMALGGHETTRVTRIGRILRKTRLDELPQIFNVLRGDIKFIGPRPPLRTHVKACPEPYRRILTAVPPGITGLATVTVHRREARLLSACRTAAEAETVYMTRCLPVKLRLDMIYAKKRSLALDFLIVWRTFSRLVPHRTTAAPLEDSCTERASWPAKTAPLPVDGDGLLAA